MMKKQATKLGINEALKHELFHVYPVLGEKVGEYVAQFKYTVVIGKNGTIALTGLPVNAAQYKTENKVTNEELSKLLAVRNISLQD